MTQPRCTSAPAGSASMRLGSVDECAGNRDPVPACSIVQCLEQAKERNRDRGAQSFTHRIPPWLATHVLAPSLQGLGRQAITGRRSGTKSQEFVGECGCGGGGSIAGRTSLSLRPSAGVAARRRKRADRWRPGRQTPRPWGAGSRHTARPSGRPYRQNRL